MRSLKQRQAARRNIKKARRKWMRMSSIARRKTMPSRIKHPSRRYPIGSYITKDVGRIGHHYIIAKKMKYGWSKPKLVTKSYLQRKVSHARRKWMRMSHAARKRAMPGRGR